MIIITWFCNSATHKVYVIFFYFTVITTLLTAILFFVVVACLVVAVANGIMIFLLIKQFTIHKSVITFLRPGPTNWYRDIRCGLFANTDAPSCDTNDQKKLCVLPIQSVDDIKILDMEADGGGTLVSPLVSRSTAGNLNDPESKRSERRPRRDYEVIKLPTDSEAPETNPVLDNPDAADGDNNDDEDAKPPVPPKSWTAREETQSKGSKEPNESEAQSPVCIAIPDRSDADDVSSRYCQVVKISRPTADADSLKSASIKRGAPPATDRSHVLQSNETDSPKRRFSLDHRRPLTAAYCAVEPDTEHHACEARQQCLPLEVASTAGAGHGVSQSEVGDVAPVVPPRETKLKKMSAVCSYEI